MAQLGDVLTAPEAGWKSYSDSEIEELYNNLSNGNNSNGKDHYYYRNTAYLAQSAINNNTNNHIEVPLFYDDWGITNNNYNSLMSFKITGDKVRIISIYETLSPYLLIS